MVARAVRGRRLWVRRVTEMCAGNEFAADPLSLPSQAFAAEHSLLARSCSGGLHSGTMKGP